MYHCIPIELDTSVPDMKDIGATLRKSNVVIQSRDEDTIQVLNQLPLFSPFNTIKGCSKFDYLIQINSLEKGNREVSFPHVLIG